MVNGMAGKGDDPRPCSISYVERSLRYEYAFRKGLKGLEFDAWLDATGNRRKLDLAREKFRQL